ncbi:MAG: hypothetical protein GX585_02520 [Clostridiales bacterium]|nr:hypothetical protein [Clostridiales bacterium]
MEQIAPENKELITRLAYCIVAALVVYYAGDKALEHFQPAGLEKYRPWLTQNKIQAVAVITAVLLGVSLAVWPLEEKKESGLGPDRESNPDTYI